MAAAGAGGVTDRGAPAGDGSARLEATVRGFVQGVGFRYFVRTQALQLGVDGWVANLPDGSVAVVAEGERSALERFAEALSVGPPGASVRDVDVQWTAAVGGLLGFGIRSGAHPGD
jgi:acylphosphatase